MNEQIDNGIHRPVLVESIALAISTQKSGDYVDASFGRGGHAVALLSELGSDARLLVIDRDPAAIAVALNLALTEPRLRVEHGKFSDIRELAKFHEMSSFDGVLFDAGVSTPQLWDSARGFSFLHDGPLDMRMDNSEGVTAAQWLNTTSEEELRDVLKAYGEERYARRIARAIVHRRPVSTTKQLVDIVLASGSTKERSKHPATRVFQAVRIRINNELRELDLGIQMAFSCLKIGGRIGVLTFHSLEHRIVRQKFREWSQPNVPRRMPVRDAQAVKARIVIKGQRPSSQEILQNERSRTAMFQVVERVA